VAHKVSATPGAVVGAALAGLFDGIVMQQILQWHHMISIGPQGAVKTVDTLQREIFYDGWFQAAMLALLGAGLWLLVGELRRSALITQQRFWGSALLGAGAFNVVEGIISHHVLGIHHVTFGAYQLAWDIAFLAAGVAMAVAGFYLFQQPTRSIALVPGYRFIRNTLRAPAASECPPRRWPSSDARKKNGSALPLRSTPPERRLVDPA